MPNSSLKTNFNKQLFLVCPTDSMEQTIINHFIGEGYFCTALGAYFEFDFLLQSKLRELICEHRIQKVVFVTTIDNVFYTQMFKKNMSYNYPVIGAIAKAKKQILKHISLSQVFPANNYLLAAQHLKNQKKRLLDTHYLGNHITEENIIVEAYVYKPEKKNFYCYREVEKIGYLLNSISYN